MENSFNNLNKETRIKLALSFENPDIVTKFCEEHSIDEITGNQYFQEVKKFLYLCANTTDRLAPSADLDKVWHTFILFTKEYRQYCQQFLGKFIDHVPEVKKDTSVAKENYLQNTIAHYEREFGDLNNQVWQIPFLNNTDEDDDSNCSECSSCNNECQSCSSCEGRGSQPSCVYTGNCFDCTDSGYSCVGENPNDL